MALTSRQLIQEYEDIIEDQWAFEAGDIVDRFMKETHLDEIKAAAYPLMWFLIRELKLDWDEAIMIMTDTEWH